MTGQDEGQAPGHAFISYVREDSERVDRLQRILEDAGITVWRDTDSLWPGQDWRAEIRTAITANSLAFIACFSEHTDERSVSFQNEELMLAAEQMRQRTLGSAWLIPVRFARCAIPAFDLGAGRTLHSLQRIDLFDGSWERGTPRLIGAVMRALGFAWYRAGDRPRLMKAEHDQSLSTGTTTERETAFRAQVAPTKYGGISPEAERVLSSGLDAQDPDTTLTWMDLVRMRVRAGSVEVRAAYGGRAIRRFTIHATLPEQLAPLRTLMLNLRWSWHAPTQGLFAEIDPTEWERSGHDPFRLLTLVSPQRLADLAAAERFLKRLREAVDNLDEYLSTPRWYGSVDELADGPVAIAYFSPEYGITEALPLYAGGLGILAGDHLKSASDLGLPVLGVGLLYRYGYFTQSLSAEGWQAERYAAAEPTGLPIVLLRDESGVPARVTVGLAGGDRLSAQIWVAYVGRVPLLLLDSYIEDNDPLLREVTDRLYGSDHRLRQALLLGIGGVRAVRRYCAITGHPQPEVFHANEGYAGFLGIERIREYMAGGVSFAEAVDLTRAGGVFTTHSTMTTVLARFSNEEIESQFAPDGGEPGLPIDQLLALGAETYPGGNPGVFNMAVMGIRLAQRVNGVSRLHGEVSRQMFTGLWPGFGTDEAPIAAITNGVHGQTWVATEVLGLAQNSHQAGAADWPGDDCPAWEAVGADVARIFQIRRTLRVRLVKQARARLWVSWRQRGASEAELGWIAGALDEDILTIGLACGVPSFKRLTLILRDPDRLTALLLDPDRPVQFVIAGKAHPADEGAKALIQQMVRFADDPVVRHRIVFLPDYDMALSRAMVQGCDVWLNNPLRPFEACGTSGMKAALNGALNISVLDGWWDEWFDGETGWAIPSADSVTDPQRRDEVEAAALYDLLGLSVAPTFYDRGSNAMPQRWLEMITRTWRMLGPKVQATRMVRLYTTDLYLPAARAVRALATDAARPFAGIAELSAWKQRVTQAWPHVRIEVVESEDDGGQWPGAKLTVRAGVVLGALGPEDVRVELVYGITGPDDEIANPVRTELSLESPPGLDSVAWYSGEAILGRTGQFGCTVRVVPTHPLLASPAEMGLLAVPVASAGVISGGVRASDVSDRP